MTPAPGWTKVKTAAVHAGERLESSRAVPLSAPIFAAAASYFDDAEALDGALDGKDDTYTRIRGPNAALLEEAVAALEGTEDCAAFPSGMAALKASPLVERVHYPGLKEHPQHQVAKRMLQGGFGGMLAFEMAGVRENLIRVSVGLEDPDDVADDLLQAVAAAMEQRPAG